LSKEYAAPSATWKLLMATRPELILFLDITTRQSAVEQKIKAFLTKWPQYRQKMPLLKMTEMRITPDLPVYQKLLDEMFFLMLDGKLKNEAEIVKFLEPHQPPLPVAPPTPTRRGRGKKKVAAKPAAAPAPAAPEQAASSAQAAPAQQEIKPAKTAKKEAAPAKLQAQAAAPAQAPQKTMPPKGTPKAGLKPAPKKPAPKKAKPAKKAAAKPTAKKSQAKSAKKGKR
jgi:tRNA nucleotidyltransferase (CCA-adding enzyme)